MAMSLPHTPRKPPFVAGEPQQEALARIEYLHARGGGWCEIAGPQGIGKTSLLAELSRRAQLRGELCAWLDLGPLTSFDWFSLLADAWRIDLPAGTSTLDARRRFEDHFAGWRAMNRTAWLFIDDADGFAEDLSRGCRWLCQVSQGMELPLLLIVARQTEGTADSRGHDADLNVELWPWEPPDCKQFVEACAVRRGSPGSSGSDRCVTFSSEAIAALCERSAGLPRDVAKLVEWSLAAADAESLADVEPELIHAIADEISPAKPECQRYESSAGYGAW